MFRLLKMMKAYRLECVLAPLFKMLEAFFELFVPLVVADIIDNGIKTGDKPYIFSRALIMAALAIIGLLCSVTAQYFSAKAAVGFSAKVRNRLFHHIGGFSYTKTDRIGTPTLLARLSNDLNQVQTGVNLTLRLLLRSPFIVFGCMIMAFTIDAKSATVFAITIPVLCVVVFGVMLINIPLYKKVQTRLDRVLGDTRENLTGVRVIRAFGLEDSERTRFDKANREHTRMQRFVGSFSALMNPVTYVIVNFAVIALIYVGAWQVEGGAISQGDLVALYNYMTQILVELVKMASLIISITKAVACGNRIQAVFDMPTEDLNAVEAPQSDVGHETTALRFEHVSFRYAGASETSLSDISFSLEKGQTLGIIGGTGSGKTSVVHLIPRFYDAESGKISVNGKNIRAYSLSELRAMVGIVPQKAVLFHGTIRSNLLLGNEDATEEELWAALEAAQAADFVRTKDGGLDAVVEQNGKNFSGGQRQRLTIARALVRKPQILILDDSSSALDYATDAKLRKAIASLTYHPTVVLVSQRTAALSAADAILVLEDGESVGYGTHEELLKSCETYAEIHYSQFEKEDAE
ncbi:MAG: ABC transporter ATP-binding protein [Clostridia bacterium]|nr:ABC transporter ATP-binding protein [Clostridia bacterium]